MNDTEKMKRATKLYVSFLAYTESLFNSFSEGNKLDYNPVAEKIKIAGEFIQKDRRFLMKAKQVVKQTMNENYHAAHAVRSTIIAMITGTYLKLPKHRLIELGVAALLRDIDKLHLPAEVFTDGHVLTEEERKQVYVHPLNAYKTLKSFLFPADVCVAVLEHHEQMNGAGYPQKLAGKNISLYGKIIRVACSYEVYSTKEIGGVKCGHRAMMKLLKNEGKKYDETVIRALLSSISIYPIGMYVLLSDGRQAQVVDIDPENPRFPIVKIRGEALANGENITICTSPNDCYIARPLSREEFLIEDTEDAA
jgi:HD-GYP domain-containing protein (c-di-GMP phosphodiesterase class II)